MTDCTTVRDRMPQVAGAADSWSSAELAHLASCAECAHEWRIVQAGASLHAGVHVDVERVTQAVMARLRETPGEPGVLARIPWRGSIIGLLAAAASVAVILSAPRLERPAASGASDTMALAVLPELQGLDEIELESLLQSLGPSAADATPGVLPHLEDLTDSELEQLLRSQGGGTE